MSARSKKKAAPKKAAHPTYMAMAVEAIVKHSHFGHGASRQAIANHIKSTYKLEGSAAFNSALRRALQKGLADGMLEHGDSVQRFKLSAKGRKARADAMKPKPKKKKAKKAKKKVTKKKKKVTKKRKK